LEVFGKHDGYQFLWKELESKMNNGIIQFSFLNKDKFYSISSLAADTTNIFLTRTGANDPNFNLRSTTSLVLRKTKQSPTFLSVIELHGFYDTRDEFAYDSYSNVKDIKMVQQDENISVFKIILKNATLLFAIAHNNVNQNALHQINISNEVINWEGPYYYKKINN
jgi:hypothetical protein